MDEKEKVQLKEGPMSWQDLSIWFGLKPTTISKGTSKAKANKLKKLEGFADFHLEGRKLIIDKVKFPFYSKALDVIEEELPKRWGQVMDDDYQVNKVLKEQKIDTCARVGKEIWQTKKEVQSQVSLKTAQKYANTAKVKQYGHNYLNDRGARGESRFIRMNEDGSAPLQGEQLEIFMQCKREAYEGAGELIAEIDTAYRNGEISKEEKEKAQGMINTDSSYDRMVALCIERLGFYPEQRTQIIDINYFE